MADCLIAPKTCGNCGYGPRVDINVIECHGIPPTPAMVQAGVDALGRPQWAVHLLRARMAANEPACALWGPQSREQAALADLARAPAQKSSLIL